MPTKINTKEALDIFEDHLNDIKNECLINMQHELTELEKNEKPKPNKSYTLWWVLMNIYQMRREEVTKKYLSTIRSIEFRQQPMTPDKINPIDIERAKERPIADLLQVTKKGNISCPFHQDRTPSFQIRRNNTFMCYSCGEHGDVIALYQKLHNTDFISAVKALR